MLTFDISGAQIDGARDYQEDAFLITHLGDSDSEGGSLVIVADGMGGHAAGNVASNMAVQTFNKHVTSNFPNENLAEILRESVTQANNSISETVRETAALKGMGCTLVAAVLEDRFIRWVSVGDSHLYLIRNGELTKKNADHSYGGFLDRMAAEGTPVEAEAGFSRNMLMSALTGEDIAEVDCPETPLELEAGDRVIVASDGLDTLSQGKILSFAAEAESAKECVDALLQGVESAKMPRQDNTTVIIVDIGEKAEPEPKIELAIPTTVEAAEPTAPENQPFIIEEDEPEKSGSGLIIALVMLLLLGAAGGGYWFMTRDPGPPVSMDIPDEPIVEEPDDTDPDLMAEPEPEPEPEPDIDEPDTPAEPEPQIAPAPEVSRGETFADSLKSGGQGPSMVWVAGGEFMMGARDSGAIFDERPQHTVTVQPFAMSTHEITIAQYNKFARTNSRKKPKTGDLEAATYPVFFVSWNDAVAYAKWLSSQTGQSYRLPTEAEWEYAMRAGGTTAYPWGRKLGRDNAHCFACDTGLDQRRPTKVGRFDPNAFGIHDLAGNVEEWIYDCYNPNYEGAPSDGSVFEGGDCAVRVVRGGAYSSGPRALRSSARNKFPYNKSNDSIGIRIVRDQ